MEYMLPDIAAQHVINLTYLVSYDIDTKTVKGILLSACFDSPARCIFQNVIQFNGRHGCAYCESQGKTVKTSENGSTQTYPFNTSNTSGHGKSRTHTNTGQYAENAKDRGSPVVGGQRIFCILECTNV